MARLSCCNNGESSPDKVVGAVSVIQHYYGRDDVPIGAYKGTGNGGVSSYVKLLADNWPSPLKSKSEVADRRLCTDKCWLLSQITLLSSCQWAC